MIVQSLWDFIKKLQAKEDASTRIPIEDTSKKTSDTDILEALKQHIISYINSYRSYNDIPLKHPKFVKPTEMSEDTLQEIKHVSDVSRKYAYYDKLKQYRIEDMIAKSEGTDEDTAKQRGYKSGYDVTLGYGKFVDDKSRPLTDMTLDEVFKLQKKMKAHPKNRFFSGKYDKKGNKIYYPSSAVGRYQFTEPTLRRLVKKLNLSTSTKFTPKVQDMLAQELIKESGLSNFQSGKITKEDFIHNLSTQWASVADPLTGKSHYGQHTNSTLDEWSSVLDNYLSS